MIQILKVRKPSGSNGNNHEAIEKLRWIVPENGKTGVSSREAVYDWIKAGGKAFVRDAAKDVAFVGARINARGTKYLQTYADKTWRDNLLALPTF